MMQEGYRYICEMEQGLATINEMRMRESTFEKADYTVLLFKGYNEAEEEAVKDVKLQEMKVIAKIILGCKHEEKVVVNKRKYISMEKNGQEMEKLGIIESKIKFDAKESANQCIYRYERRIAGFLYRVITLPIGDQLLDIKGEIIARNRSQVIFEQGLPATEKGLQGPQLEVRRAENKKKLRDLLKKGEDMESCMNQKIFTMNHVIQVAVDNSEKLFPIQIFKKKTECNEAKDIIEDLAKYKTYFTFPEGSLKVLVYGEESEEIEKELPGDFVGYFTPEGKLISQGSESNEALLQDKYYTREKTFQSKLYNVRLPFQAGVSLNDKLTKVLNDYSEQMSMIAYKAIFVLASPIKYISIKEKIKGYDELEKSDILFSGLTASPEAKDKIPLLRFENIEEEMRNIDFLHASNMELKTYFTDTKVKTGENWDITVEKGYEVIPFRLKGFQAIDEINTIVEKYDKLINAQADFDQKQELILLEVKEICQILMDANGSYIETANEGEKEYSCRDLQLYFNYVEFILKSVQRVHKIINRPMNFIVKLKDFFPKLAVRPEYLIHSLVNLEKDESLFAVKDLPDHFYSLLLRLISRNVMNAKELVVGFEMKLKFQRVLRIVASKDLNSQKLLSACTNLYQILQDRRKLQSNTYMITFSFEWLDIYRLLAKLLTLFNQYEIAFHIYRKFDDIYQMKHCATLALSLETNDLAKKCLLFAGFFVEINQFDFARLLYERAYSEVKEVKITEGMNEAAIAEAKDMVVKMKREAKKGELDCVKKENPSGDAYAVRMKNFLDGGLDSEFANGEIDETVLMRIKGLEWDEASCMCVCKK